MTNKKVRNAKTTFRGIFCAILKSILLCVLWDNIFNQNEKENWLNKQNKFFYCFSNFPWITQSLVAIFASFKFFCICNNLQRTFKKPLNKNFLFAKNIGSFRPTQANFLHVFLSHLHHLHLLKMHERWKCVFLVGLTRKTQL